MEDLTRPTRCGRCGEAVRSIEGDLRIPCRCRRGESETTGR